LVLLGPALASLASAPPESAADPAILVLPYLQLPTPTSMTVLWETNRKLPGVVDYGTTPDLGCRTEAKQDGVLHEATLTGLQPATCYFYRVRSGPLTSAVYSFRTAPAAGTPRWRFAFYGDSRSNPATHHKVAECIRQAGVDLIVHSGDIVANGKDRERWRKEFFEPLGDLLRSTPWVSTIGNHERDAENYFSYVSLPGNERFYVLDFGNVRFLCLDSNTWVEKGRDSEQGRWLQEELARPRAATWTFAVFHHPLFSAHATRAIDPLRWDWAPLFLDPAHKVDGVLTGHDHFFARNWRMGRLADKPQPGVLFLTSAGGGAPLYKCKARDFVAAEKSAHHFCLFDVEGERIRITATDIAGKEIDRYVLHKGPTPPDEFCAYEVEELRRDLRLALAAAKPVRFEKAGPTTIDAVLKVPQRFQVPVAGELIWGEAPGWKMKVPRSAFKLQPGQPLEIPLQAQVQSGPLPRWPTLTIAFEPGRFRNRTIELSPFQAGGPERVAFGKAAGPLTVDGLLDEADWQRAPALSLLGLPPQGGRADRVRLLADDRWLYLGAELDDPAGEVRVKAGAGNEGGKSLLSGDHVALILAGDKHTHTFAIGPDQVRYHEDSSSDVQVAWSAVAACGRGTWSVEMQVPRTLFDDWSAVRINVQHRRKEKDGRRDLHLCPSFRLGPDPDRLPDVVPGLIFERLATVELP
jgi:hypothetical protein